MRTIILLTMLACSTPSREILGDPYRAFLHAFLASDPNAVWSCDILISFSARTGVTHQYSDDLHCPDSEPFGMLAYDAIGGFQ